MGVLVRGPQLVSDRYVHCLGMMLETYWHGLIVKLEARPDAASYSACGTSKDG